MLNVHVRVNDAATGRPTPVRLRLLDAAGNYHPPFGRLTDFATGAGEDVGGNVRLGEGAYAYIDGACEVLLPPGKVTVEVHKGFEYTPLRREVTLGPGQISLRLAVERRADLLTEGWYSGDTRAHDLSPHAALLEGAAEDLAFVHLLARERPAASGQPASVSNLLAFSGTRPALEGNGCAVVVNTLNAHPVLGTVSLLNSHRAVFPLRSGDPAGADDWSVADWCDQCHRKKGLVVWADLPRLTPEHPQGEALAALLLGKIDAFEVCSFPEVESPAIADWYRLLNCGCRLPLAGGSGKDGNAVALGAMRTYARLMPGEEPGVAPWVEAVRDGRTFVTNGPLLSLAVDSLVPGSTVLAEAGQMLHVLAEARGTSAVDRVEVIMGGEVVASGTAVETELPVTPPTWIAARCRGRERRPDGQRAFAHTSAVYIDTDVKGRPMRPDAATAATLLTVLDRTRDWVAHAARCPTERHREHLAEVLDAGRDELRRRQGA
jgi:hypothetical protein